MAQVNGDVSSSAPSSAFVQHLLDYPVVHDGVASFKQNPYVNGDVSSSAPSSAFVQHLLDYPVVHDGVTSFKQNPYGQKSLQLSDSAYKTFAQPFIPYLAGPFEFVRPYLQKADTFGDQALSKVDQQVPFVKKPTNELYADLLG
ncbi:hypothetical protein HYQ46_008540 [Verticillium longisporum]|nr:hypothetical protein HYQ46_008540 [Verticillium longisporum]